MADKGIRVNVNHKFVELLAQRETLGNTVFRKNVMFYAMESFGISLASAATHYNHAFKTVKASNPELVSGLGRADDKKGGRKPTAKVVAAAVQLLLGHTPATIKDEVQTEFKVCKKSDSTVIAEGLSFEDARAMVVSGRVKGRFCKMYWV